ncbi:MAG: Bax inhibitor-1/YccA family protein [Mailhella sp.]|nr:Bax inhibitor-1/YccA family protein [Mailhella sp.]
MNISREQVQGYARSNVAVYMQQVYLWMTCALGVTAIAALFTASNPAIIQALFANTISMVLMVVAIFGLSMYITARMHTLSSGTATGLFLLYSALMGVFLGPVLLVYTGSSVAQAFIVTAGTFGGMSVYGMVTKRDLSGMGNFMIMGLWGIILASLVNMFIGNSAVDLTISVLGVIIFTGLTAWDTQKLRMMGMSAPVDDAVAKRRGALLGALTLYLDFIKMFLMMLRLFGNRE